MSFLVFGKNMGSRRSTCPKEVGRSARLLQSYELDFWQVVDEPLDSPLPVVRQASLT